MTIQIRLADEADAAAVVEIYGPFCERSPITFETTVPALEEIEDRIRKIGRAWPWLVCERNGEVLGYAYASRHHDRAAYRWSVDAAIYLGETHRGQRIGTALYSALFECLRIQGYANVYAAITLPNAASVAIHERFGFEMVGIYRRVGYKSGAWHDVGWWGLSLKLQFDGHPAEPLLMKDLKVRDEFHAALKSAEHLVRS